MAYELLLLVLAVFKARIIWKETVGLRGFNLVGILIRDQVIYYLAYVLSFLLLHISISLPFFFFLSAPLQASF